MSIQVDIHKKFNGFSLDTAFEADEEVLGVLGASGSGKSMTLRCIAGIEKPDRGRIVINGRICYDSEKGIWLPPQQRHTGYLFQQYALFPKMTVAENIMVGLNNRKDDSVLKHYLSLFRLTGLENHYPSQLSGGQQQRTALARIFAHQPAILLLDEPFSALDTFLKWELQCELKYLLDEFKGTTLFVSHSRDEVFRICDKVAVLENGTVVQSGPVLDVFSNPETVASTRLTGCKNISRIKKTGDYTVAALDWGIEELRVSEKVGKDITHIGIRAHFFSPGDENAVNSIPIDVKNIIESQFKVSVLFQKKGTKTSKNLCWDYERIEFNTPIQALPSYLSIDPKHIILLKGDGNE